MLNFFEDLSLTIRDFLLVSFYQFNWILINLKLALVGGRNSFKFISLIHNPSERVRWNLDLILVKYLFYLLFSSIYVGKLTNVCNRFSCIANVNLIFLLNLTSLLSVIFEYLVTQSVKRFENASVALNFMLNFLKYWVFYILFQASNYIFLNDLCRQVVQRLYIFNRLVIHWDWEWPKRLFWRSYINCISASIMWTFFDNINWERNCYLMGVLNLIANLMAIKRCS